MSEEQPPTNSASQPTSVGGLLLRTVLAIGFILAGGIGLVWYVTK